MMVVLAGAALWPIVAPLVGTGTVAAIVGGGIGVVEGPEEDDYAAHVDLVSGQATVTGQSWHLRDERGRLVVAGAGLFAIDLLTGDVLTGTPHVKTDGRAIVCPALGGAPAD